MNETLRLAMVDAELDEVDVASRLEVDPKTVRRWLEGRVPFPRHRLKLARLVGVDEIDLWPEVAAARAAKSRPSEIKAAYVHRSSVPSNVWRELFHAERDVAILAYSGLFLAEDAEMQDILSERARSGVRVRVALGDPDCAEIAQRGVEEGIGDAMSAKVRNALRLYRGLTSIDGVELRLHRTVLYNSIYRGDDEMLVNQHLYGVPAAQAPVFHLRRSGDSEMFGRYVESFETIWGRAEAHS